MTKSAITTTTTNAITSTTTKISNKGKAVPLHAMEALGGEEV
jgi:hypothetical protein